MKIEKRFNGSKYSCSIIRKENENYTNQVVEFFKALDFTFEPVEGNNENIFKLSWGGEILINNISVSYESKEEYFVIYANKNNKISGGRVQIKHEKDYIEKELKVIKEKINDLLIKRQEYLNRQNENNKILDNTENIVNKINNLLKSKKFNAIDADYYSASVSYKGWDSIEIKKAFRNQETYNYFIFFEININIINNHYIINIPTEKIPFKNIKEYEENLLAEIVRVKELNKEAEGLINFLNKEIFDNKLIKNFVIL